MGGLRFYQGSFNAGEWSPLMEGQVDLEKYPNALYRMENFLIDPRGPAFLRPGFRFVHPAKYGNKKCRVIRFEFSTTQAYMLEFGDQYIRFFKDKSIITLTPQAITGITKANPAVLTYGGADTYSNGDRVVVAGVAGMYQVNNREFTVANVNVGANTFELSGVNSTNYGAFTAGGTVAKIYEIASPYLEADLPGLKANCQSADVLYIRHPSYPPRKLSRTGHTSWTLSTINYRPPPLDVQGIAPATTLTLAAVTGLNIQFDSGVAAFLSGDVGRVITSGIGRAAIITFNSTTQVRCDIIDDFSSVGPIATGSWKIGGSPVGSIFLNKKSPVGDIATITSTSGAETFTNLLDHPVVPNNNWRLSAAGTNEYYLHNSASFYSAAKPSRVYINSVQCAEGVLGTLGITQWGWGNNDVLGYNTIYIRLADGADPDTKSTAGAPDDDFVQRSEIAAAADLFRAADVGKYIVVHSGLIKITQYISAQSVRGQIMKELTAITGTTAWTLEAEVWNAANGYPSCAAFFEERLCEAGSPAYPETVWGSVAGDYENHTPGPDDADAFDFTITGKEVSIIRWLEPDEYLLVGQVGKISRLGPTDIGKPLTPTNVMVKRQSPDGVANIVPVTAGNAVLYVQRTGFDGSKGGKLGELTWSWEKDKYVTPDMSILAEHVTRPGLAGIAYQQKLNSIIWGHLSDGNLVSMTYLREENVVGWSRHPKAGVTESADTIPGDGYDELWAVNKYTVNGATVRYIEVLEPRFMDTTAQYTANKGLNAFFVDSGLTYNGAPATTITGLAHLEGETVAVLGDGGYMGTKVVQDTKIVLDTAVSVAHVGRLYSGVLQTMRPEAKLRDGTAQGRVKSVSDVNIRVYCSGPFLVGSDAANLDTCEDRDREIVLGAPYPLYSGDLRVGYDGRFEKDARLMIVQNKPLPLTVVAIMPEIGVN